MSLDNASRKDLAQLVTNFSLRDSFRLVGGLGPTYTWRNNRQEGRKSWCLEQSVILDQRKLYCRLRDELVEGAEKVTLHDGVDRSILQPSYLVSTCKDLNWLTVLGRQPVRERLYRHGQGR